MSVEEPSSERITEVVHSGSEIVSAFVTSLKNDPALDIGTIDAIDDLWSKGKLTLTNLLKSLEEARGKTSI